MIDRPFIRQPMTGHRQMISPSVAFRRPAVSPPSGEATTLAHYRRGIAFMKKERPDG